MFRISVSEDESMVLVYLLTVTLHADGYVIMLLFKNSANGSPCDC